MRVMDAATICLIPALFFVSVSLSYSEPTDRTVSFSMVYNCDKEETNGTTAKGELCFTGKLEPGLSAVLVGKKENCTAKTAETFTDQYVGNKFEATRLTGTENCSALIDSERPYLAVLGIDDPSAVRTVESKIDVSVLSKDVQLRARKIAGSEYQKMQVTGEAERDVADSPPDVFAIANAAFVLFKCTDDFLNQDGLPVLILNNNAFPLKGSCASVPPMFFTVNEKLYLMYSATVSCCGCGDVCFFIYDISGESPVRAYVNCDFSS